MADNIDLETPIYRGGSRRPGMDPATRRLTVFAAGLGAVLILVLGTVSLLNHRGGGAVPVIAADSGPMKIKPANRGGMQIADGNTDVMANSQGTDQGKLAPAPEVPDPAALAAERAAAARASAAPAPHAAPAIAARAPEPVAAAATPVPARPVPAHPVPAPPALAHAAAPAAESARASAPAGHVTQVQLAALSSSESAHAEWAKLQHRMPGLFDGHQPAVSRFVLGGHVFWRLRTGGFANIDAAKHFCEQVRAKGNACSIAAF